MLVLLLATALAAQAVAPQASDAAAQARGQEALSGMVEIFATMGACERHFTPEQASGVRRGFEPAAGHAPSPLQAYLAQAYERGKANTSLSAPACQAMIKALAKSKGG